MKTLIATMICLAFSLLPFQSRADIGSVTASDKAFFERLQTAVSANDIEWLSTVLSYPLVVHMGKAKYTLQNKDDFASHAKLILTPHLKLTVQSQSENSLFKNWQGVRIGDGEIWFSEVSQTIGSQRSWVKRIIGINLPDH